MAVWEKDENEDLGKKLYREGREGENRVKTGLKALKLHLFKL